MWSLCKTEETRLKAKEDVGSKEQAFATMAKRKETIWQIWSTKNKQQGHVQNPILDAKNVDTTKGIVLNLRRTTTTREKGKKLI